MENNEQIKERRQSFNRGRKLEHEVRAEENGAKSLVIRGYAILFDDKTEIHDYYGDYTEVIDKKALANTDISKVYLLFNHNSDNVLGRSDVNLRLEIDDTGLFFECILPNTQLARDVYNLIEPNIIDGMSFGFTSSDYVDPVSGTRVIKTIDNLYEISITPFPAYEDTSVITKSESEKTSKIEDDREKKRLDAENREKTEQASKELEKLIDEFNRR